MTNKFEIERLKGNGMRAKVIDVEKSYTTYTDFADAIGYPDAVGKIWTEAAEEKGRNVRRLKGETVRILAKGKHGWDGSTIYAVENEEGERFLIGEEGLDHIQHESIAEMPEMTYVGIAEPLGEQVREVIRKAYAEGFEAGREFERKPFVSPKEEAQERRDRIVERAKKDIEDLKYLTGLITGRRGYRAGGGVISDAEFIVNKDKRTVVCLLKGQTYEKINARGIAKCAPDDCFNVHIGKAIALRRALGYKVPDEYLNAPQPTEVRVGDIIEFTNGRIAEVVQKDSVGGTIKDNKTKIIYSAVTFEKVRIIDDSRDEVGG